MNKLEAVNIILAAAGQAPTNSLDGSLTASVAMAQNVLNEVREDILLDGWSFNTDYEKPYTPDATTGEVVLPDDIISIDGSPGKNDSRLDLTIRRGKVYDVASRTYNFSSLETVYLDVIEDQEFDEIPLAAQSYIAKKAARVFVDRTMNNAQLSQVIAQEEYVAHVALEKWNNRNRDYNMITGSNFTSRQFARRRNPFNRF